MRHHRSGWHDRRFARPEDPAERRPGGQHGPHRRGRHGGGRHGTRAFDYGELRLLALALIARAPRHGYELMKAIGEQTGGSYSPSPGVIYPTLAWLEDMGFAAAEAAEAGGRKAYRITAAGEAFLADNRADAEALLARGAPAGGPPEGVPAPILRGMENLKLALRLRLRRGALEPQAVDSIAAALDAAARSVERS
ncbi:MAG: PadR family transcriptional regulator [Geminicoccaceae bacterium]